MQKSTGKVLASIFGVKIASSSLIIFQRAKISAGAIEGHFEGKVLREGHQEDFVLA